MIRPPLPAVGMQFSSLSSASPSFTSYSSNNLADIAARVVEEFRKENGHEDDDDDIYNFDNNDMNHVDDEPEDNYTEILKESEEESDEDGEFEFPVVRTQYNSSTGPADSILFNGEIVTQYPLFDRSLLLDDVAGESDGRSKAVRVSPVRRPLRKLFNEERESESCSSSSEADDLDGVTPGTYCIWKPKVESVESCKKSNSTGSSSKRWKFRNLVHRSNSEGHMDSCKNASVIVFRPLTVSKKRSEKVKKVEKMVIIDPAAVTDEANSITVSA